MKFFFSAILTFCVTFSLAQSGNFLLSNYSPSKDRMNNVCFQIAQTESGLMYFATRIGLLSFDGRTWDLITGSGAIYTIQIDQHGTMYWGGANGFGELIYNNEGLPELTTISDNAKEIFQSLSINDKVYFLNDETLFILDINTKKHVIISATTSTGDFAGVHALSNSVFLTTAKGKIYKVEDAHLIDRTFPFLNGTQIIFSATLKDRQLIGLSSNEVYVAEKGRTFRKVVLKDQSYLNENILVSGSWVDDDLIVLGTLRGGLVFVNLSNGKTHEIINYSTGLPDNEIFSIATDRDQSVWAAHEYGFTRIAPHLPFRSFSYYPGLSGNLLCALSFRNSVYVGTSLGLYKLEKEEVYHDQIFYETAAGQKEGSPKKNETGGSVESAEANDSKRKGFFRLFRKRKSVADTNISSAITEEGSGKEKSVRRKPITKTKKVLVTSKYRYKKVNGIDAKITQLIAVDEKLIACGLEGTFEINGMNARVLVNDPTKYIYSSRSNVLFAATYSDELKTMRWNGAKWIDIRLLENVSDHINHIFDGSEGEIWLCALDKIYRLQMNGDEVLSFKSIAIENPGYDEFVGVQLATRCVVGNANGFYQFNPVTNSFVPIDSLATKKLSSYFSRNESIWYRDTHGWNYLGNETASANLRLLNLFKNIRFITSDANSANLWVITDDNELYQYFTDRIRFHQEKFPMVLKTVRNGDYTLGGRSVLEVDQDNSRLTFEVVQPDFLAADAIEYRYHLTGLDQEWTEWSQANNTIEIPYLPSGEYSLEVEARDIFGRQSSLEKVFLNVLPPFWKRPWFYALEVLFFSFLVIVSFRLSTRYRIISRLLMLLTIIMLIQFVETIIGQTLPTTTSPVIDFLIQVVIAMMVLPVEGYLRELMLRSLDTSNRFYRFIAPKGLSPQKSEEDFE